MRPRLTRRLALAVGAAAALVMPVAAAPAALTPPASAAEPKRLVTAVSQTVDTFNPFMSFFAIGYTVSGLAYDSLIDWDSKSFAAKPGIATGWTESPDHLTWTFNIREGVKFSDNKPLTAKDVEFTFHTMMTNEDARDSSSDLVENFESVSAPDDTTFIVKLKKPTNQMLALDSAIVPKHIWEKHLANLGDFTNFQLPMIGSGPFQVVEFKKDQFIRMRANKNYWDGAPAYDELVFRYYKTPDASVQALIGGEVDLVSGLQPAAYKALKKEKNLKLNQAQNRRFSSITFNMGARTKDGKPFGDGHPALTDVRVRKAIQYATNKQELIRKVDDGLAEEGVSYVPRIFGTYFWEPSASEKVNFDIQAANRILDEAGYTKGADGIRIDPKSKRPLRFRLLNHSDTPSEANDSEFLRGWWKQIGIDTKIESQDSGKLNDNLYLGKYDIIFSGWGVGPDPTSILSLHTCGTLPPDASGKFRDTETFYCNPEYDRLHEQQKAESDVAKRAAIVKQMQKILYDEAPVITLRYRYVLEAYRADRWTGFTKQPEKGGMISGQQGNWAYLSAKPVVAKADSTNASSEESGGSGSGLLIGILIAVVVLAAAGGGFFFLQRRRTAGERE